MNLYKTVCLALVASALAGSAWSAETAGRITYLSADCKQLMLDNSRVYTLPVGAGVGKVAVGQRFELKLGGVGAKRVTGINTIS